MCIYLVYIFPKLHVACHTCRYRHIWGVQHRPTCTGPGCQLPRWDRVYAHQEAFAAAPATQKRKQPELAACLRACVMTTNTKAQQNIRGIITSHRKPERYVSCSYRQKRPKQRALLPARAGIWPIRIPGIWEKNYLSPRSTRAHNPLLLRGAIVNRTKYCW